jgi:quinol monooxygenase YgiN
MIIVTGTVLARSDTFDTLLAVSTEHVIRSRGEPGCISHAVMRDTENALRLHFLECWTDMAALKAHFDVDGSQNFAKALRALVAEAPSMTLYEATEAK